MKALFISQREQLEVELAAEALRLRQQSAEDPTAGSSSRLSWRGRQH